jgi:hypothetical protein
MTEACYVAKMKKTLPMASVMEDKAWGKLFDYENNYQTIAVEFLQAGAEFPYAGIGLSYSLRDRETAPILGRGPDSERKEYEDLLTALTLDKMRGRRLGRITQGHTLHLYAWIINRDECYRRFETSIDGMKEALDTFATELCPLQAWHGQYTWIPIFDRADRYEATIYEDMSVFNFFRGILHEHQCGLTALRMTEQWCGNVLRMVTPHMWLCGDLVKELDRAALERVAVISEINGCCKIEKHRDCAMDDFELALLPILPIENSRITVLSTA